jgi:hypothetical protein
MGRRMPFGVFSLKIKSPMTVRFIGRNRIARVGFDMADVVIRPFPLFDLKTKKTVRLCQSK